MQHSIISGFFLALVFADASGQVCFQLNPKGIEINECCHNANNSTGFCKLTKGGIPRIPPNFKTFRTSKTFLRVASTTVNFMGGTNYGFLDPPTLANNCARTFFGRIIYKDNKLAGLTNADVQFDQNKYLKWSTNTNRHNLRIGWRWDIPSQRIVTALYSHINSGQGGGTEIIPLGHSTLQFTVNDAELIMSNNGHWLTIEGRLAAIRRPGMIDPEKAHVTHFSKTAFFGGEAFAPNDMFLSNGPVLMDCYLPSLLKMFDADHVQYGRSIFASGDNVGIVAHETILLSVPVILANHGGTPAGNFFIVEAGATVVADAGKEVKLLPGFHAKEGSHFLATAGSVLITDEQKFNVFGVDTNETGTVDTNLIFLKGGLILDTSLACYQTNRTPLDSIPILLVNEVGQTMLGFFSEEDASWEIALDSALSRDPGLFSFSLPEETGMVLKDPGFKTLKDWQGEDTSFVLLQVANTSVGFTAQVVCVDDSVRFANLSTGVPPLNFEWDFGDGSTSSETNPVHKYAMADTFQVTLFAVDTMGCADSLQVELVVPECPSQEKKDNVSRFGNHQAIKYQSTQLIVYPNPSGKMPVKVQFNLPEAQIISLQLLDAGGRVIWNTLEYKYLHLGLHEYYIDALNLPAGLYFVKLQKIDDVMLRKLIITEQFFR